MWSSVDSSIFAFHFLDDRLYLSNRALQLQVGWRADVAERTLIEEHHYFTHGGKHVLMHRLIVQGHELPASIARRDRVVRASRLPRRTSADTCNRNAVRHTGDLLLTFKKGELFRRDEPVVCNFRHAPVYVRRTERPVDPFRVGGRCLVVHQPRLYMRMAHKLG